ELRTGGTDTPGTPAELGHHVGHRHGPGVSRRGFPYDHVACGVLLVAYDVLGCVDPAPGDLVLVEHLLEFLGGQRTHPPLDDPVQLLGVVTACLVCGKTFVHLQPLLPHRLAETAVETVAVGGDEHFMPVRAGVDVRRRHTGKGAPGTGTSDPTEFPIGDERLAERENTLVQSHVDLLTTSAVLTFPQSSKCAVDREKTRDLVTETDPGAYRGSIRIPGKCTQTTHGLGDTAKTSIGGAWPALPESGHVDHDEARIFLDHRGVVQTPRGKSARREVLEDDVGLSEDVRGQRTVLLRLEV